MNKAEPDRDDDGEDEVAGGDDLRRPGESGGDADSAERTRRAALKQRQEEEIRVGWKMAGLGFEVAAQVAAGALLGWLFDRWRGTAPTGLLVGAVIGILVGMWTLLKGALRLNRELDLKHPTGIPRRKPTPPPGWSDDSNNDRSNDDFWNDNKNDDDDTPSSHQRDADQ